MGNESKAAEGRSEEAKGNLRGAKEKGKGRFRRLTGSIKWGARPAGRAPPHCVVPGPQTSPRHSPVSKPRDSMKALKRCRSPLACRADEARGGAGDEEKK
ncbi:hypothetical protein GCM10020000_74460 [Streptomyces olivoverticillatus]